jgi:hypothetical protein
VSGIRTAWIIDDVFGRYGAPAQKGSTIRSVKPGRAFNATRHDKRPVAVDFVRMRTAPPQNTRVSGMSSWDP